MIVAIMGGEQRPWTDISPDLLKTIYSKLPSHVPGTNFGSVCKNWHQVHSIAALSSPLPMPSDCYYYGSRIDLNNSNTGGAPIWLDYEDDINIRIRKRQVPVPDARWLGCLFHASIIARAGGWLLLRTGCVISCFFNPLLRYPENIIYLPNLEMMYWTHPNPWPIRVAFSAMPTARDWMILVVYGDRRFSTLSQGDKRFWKTYDFSLTGERAQICLGVGYRDDKFFCLFESGDMLIFSIDEDRTRVMLATDAPLSRQQLDRLGSLQVVANCPGDDKEGATVVSWGRDHEAREKNSFRLLTVERRTMESVGFFMENYDDGHETVSLEEGVMRGVILVKEQVALKTKNFEGLYDAMFVFSGIIIFVVCVGFVLSCLST